MAKLLPKQYGKILYEITADAEPKELDVILGQFLAMLRRHQMISKISHIIEAFTKYAKTKAGIQEIAITSARPLPTEQLETIAKRFGRKVETITYVDKALLGGVIVKLHNVIFDGSLRTQLRKLQEYI